MNNNKDKYHQSSNPTALGMLGKTIIICFALLTYNIIMYLKNWHERPKLLFVLKYLDSHHTSSELHIWSWRYKSQSNKDACDDMLINVCNIARYMFYIKLKVNHIWNHKCYIYKVFKTRQNATSSIFRSEWKQI